VCSCLSLSQPPTHSPKRDRADVSVGDTLPVATKANWGDSSTVPPVCVKLCGQGTTVGLADTDIAKVAPTETTTASATRRRCMSRCILVLVVRMNEVGMCCTCRCSAVQRATLANLQTPLHGLAWRGSPSSSVRPRYKAWCVRATLGCAVSSPTHLTPVQETHDPQWALTTLECLRHAQASGGG
jgi:hypothetical protein